MVDPDAGADSWTTIRACLCRPASDSDVMRQTIDALEGLAALLAERDDVGGVETRDPFSIAEGPDFTAVEQPELIVYTTPAAAALVRAATAELAAALGLELDLATEEHEGDAWRDVWKRHYRSLRFHATAADEGPPTALMIRPSWIPREPDDPTIEVILDPGRAFGTGLHESTRLCLQLLVDLAASAYARHEPSSLVDLGCGSGILALAALRLFPSLQGALLTDHDPEAVATSEENAAHNDLQARISTAVVDLLADAPLTSVLRRDEVELVLANIRPSVLIPAAPRIRALMTAGGVLILSGILDEEAAEVRAAYAELDELARRNEGGWTALALKAPDRS